MAQALFQFGSWELLRCRLGHCKYIPGIVHCFLGLPYPPGPFRCFRLTFCISCPSSRIRISARNFCWTMALGSEIWVPCVLLVTTAESFLGSRLTSSNTDRWIFPCVIICLRQMSPTPTHRHADHSATPCPCLPVTLTPAVRHLSPLTCRPYLTDWLRYTLLTASELLAYTWWGTMLSTRIRCLVQILFIFSLTDSSRFLAQPHPPTSFSKVI